MTSIWRRYQLLFARVSQLHNEERNYLVACHKERTSRLKQELEDTKSKLKELTQQYRDDQERWTNSREREDARFANMRKKLDLQVKNKRSLMIKIKALKEKLEAQDIEVKGEEAHEIPPVVQTHQTVELTRPQVSDRVHAVRHKVRTEFPHMVDVSSALDDIAHYIDQDEPETRQVKDLFPQFFVPLPIGFAGHVRSVQWLMAALTVLYGERLTQLCASRYSTKYQAERLHFVHSILQFFLKFFGTPFLASEALFDLVQTARKLAEDGNHRARMFMKFIDSSTEYLDFVCLDFYCFCLGSFVVSNTHSTSMYNDVFKGDNIQFAPVAHVFAVEFARKILFAICEGDVAERYVNTMITSLELSERDKTLTISMDLVFDFLIASYKAEERRIADQLREQYEMDAAQYGGVVTLSQFQTLVMFSPRKVDYTFFCRMMSSVFIGSSTTVVPLQSLIEEMHRSAMLVPFVFDRIDYDILSYPNDANGLIAMEMEFRTPEIDIIMGKLKKIDETACAQISTLQEKLKQVLQLGRTGGLTEVANREFYTHLAAVVID
jgi:hypothetical protein